MTKDTALVFRVTRTGASVTDSDDVMVLVEAHPQAPSGNFNYVFSDMHVSRVYPYMGSGPYASVLAAVLDLAASQPGQPTEYPYFRSSTPFLM